MEHDSAQSVPRSLKSAFGLALSAVPELAAARLESEARKLGTAVLPQVFSRDTRRLDPAFNEDLLEFAGRAEQTLRNRFTFLNRARSFGREIGWESSSSRVWRAELHSFDFILDLAIMYRVWGEERYSRHLRYLIANWIASNPPLESTGWEILPLSRRIRNWTLALDLARDGWQSDAEFAQVVARSLALQCVCLERAARAEVAAVPPQAAVSLLLSSRIFKSSAGSAHRELALRTLRGIVEKDLPVAGSRQSNSAARVGLALAILEFILFEPAADADTAQWLKRSLEAALRSVEEILLSDGSLPLFGPARPPDSEALNGLFAISAVVLDSGWAKGIGRDFGILPLLFLGQRARERFAQLAPAVWSPAHVAGSAAGLYRLAGPANSSLVVTTSTPTRSGHQDFLSYELMLRDMRVVVDSGSFAPPGENEEDYSSSAFAHNVLLADGALAGPSPAGEANVCPAELAEGKDFVRLRIERPAGPDNSRRERVFLSLADGAWIVLDRISSPRTHRLQSLIHFFPTFAIEPGEGFAIAMSLSFSLAVIPFGSSPPRMTTGRGGDSTLPGWYSPDYGVRLESSVLACEWNAVETNLTGGYLIIPGASAETAQPGVRVEGDEILLDFDGIRRRLPLRDR